MMPDMMQSDDMSISHTTDPLSQPQQQQQQQGPTRREQIHLNSNDLEAPSGKFASRRKRTSQSITTASTATDMTDDSFCGYYNGSSSTFRSPDLGPTDEFIPTSHFHHSSVDAERDIKERRSSMSSSSKNPAPPPPMQDEGDDYPSSFVSSSHNKSSKPKKASKKKSSRKKEKTKGSQSDDERRRARRAAKKERRQLEASLSMLDGLKPTRSRDHGSSSQLSTSQDLSLDMRNHQSLPQFPTIHESRSERRPKSNDLTRQPSERSKSSRKMKREGSRRAKSLATLRRPSFENNETYPPPMMLEAEKQNLVEKLMDISSSSILTDQSFDQSSLQELINNLEDALVLAKQAMPMTRGIEQQRRSSLSALPAPAPPADEEHLEADTRANKVTGLLHLLRFLTLRGGKEETDVDTSHEGSRRRGHWRRSKSLPSFLEDGFIEDDPVVFNDMKTTRKGVFSFLRNISLRGKEELEGAHCFHRIEDLEVFHRAASLPALPVHVAQEHSVTSSADERHGKKGLFGLMHRTSSARNSEQAFPTAHRGRSVEAGPRR